MSSWDDGDDTEEKEETQTKEDWWAEIIQAATDSVSNAESEIS